MIDLELLQLLFLPTLAGVGIALIAGPLGAFVVWRRMAYFGDTLAHSALLGVALGVLADINLVLAMCLAGIVVSAALWQLQRRSLLASDTLLGIISHSALALGLICVSLLAGSRINLFGFLFGDLLTVATVDVLLIYSIAIVCLGLLMAFWRPLLMCAIDEEFAKVEGIPVEAYRLLLMALLATVVAIAMKLVGVLLITALLIIPAAASRRLKQTPEGMALLASIIGALSVVLGLLISAMLDVPAGPAIVLCSTTFFILSLAKKNA